LNLSSYVISEETAKALACIMPLLPNMTHLILDDNGLSDAMCALLLLAAFMSPTLNHLELKQNSLKSSAAGTLSELLQRWPNKIRHLGLAKSVSISGHLDRWTKHLVQIKGLSVINLSQVPISTAACKNIGTCLLEAEHLK
jgi:Ran GTPase-activating protein (RanGAP) involved in mRNA processing and transport